MTAHTCRVFDPNCWRCDLSRDELARLPEFAEPCLQESLRDVRYRPLDPDEFA